MTEIRSENKNICFGPRLAEIILAYATHAGFPTNDLVFDCLAMSVGADPEAAAKQMPLAYKNAYLFLTESSVNLRFIVI